MWGWRHFQVANRKNQKTWVFAEMVAACDDTVRFWVNAKSLKDRSLWEPGWKSLNLSTENDEGKKDALDPEDSINCFRESEDDFLIHLD